MKNKSITVMLIVVSAIAVCCLYLLTEKENANTVIPTKPCYYTKCELLLDVK